MCSRHRSAVVSFKLVIMVCIRRAPLSFDCTTTRNQTIATPVRHLLDMHVTYIIAGALGLLVSSVSACKCSGVSNAGLYCGFCPQVTEGAQGKVDHAFECAKSGACKDYGKSSRCKTYWGPYCVGCDTWSQCQAPSRIKKGLLLDSEVDRMMLEAANKGIKGMLLCLTTSMATD